MLSKIKPSLTTYIPMSEKSGYWMNWNLRVTGIDTVASVAWKPKHRMQAKSNYILHITSDIVRLKGDYTFNCAVWGTDSLDCSVSWNAQCQWSHWRYSYLRLQSIFMQNFFYSIVVHCSTSLTYFCLKKVVLFCVIL